MIRSAHCTAAATVDSGPRAWLGIEGMAGFGHDCQHHPVYLQIRVPKKTKEEESESMKIGLVPTEVEDFNKRNQRFVANFAHLQTGFEIAFLRELNDPSSVDKAVFYLGRLCLEDFNEILVLCANGANSCDYRSETTFATARIVGFFLLRLPFGPTLLSVLG